ncbi:MAG: DUF6785 family protein [Candidatus Zipacnadales bacterium]
MPVDTPSPAVDERTVYRNSGVTLRVLIISFLVVPFNAYFMSFLQGPRGLEGPTVVSLFYNVVFLLLLFVLINWGLRRFAPQMAFSPAEILSFFILLSVATCTSGQDTMNTTFGTIQGAFRFNTPENGWDRMFLKYIPPSMTVSDEAALERLWRGDQSIFDPANYRVWWGPMLRWWVFYSALWAAPAGLIVIFRKRWIEREKMTFPVVQLPMEMARPGVPAFRHSAFVLAAALAASVNLINGLHSFYPQIPEIPVKIWQSQTNNIGRYFIAAGKPWDAVGWIYLCSYPFIIGLALLLPAELSLSLWFFYVFWKAEAIFCSWIGVLNRTPEFPYFKEQSFGGYLAMIGFSVWAARDYLLEAWRRIIGKAPPEVDQGEPLSYRAAFLLFVIPALYVISVGISQHMAVAVSVAFFVQYYLMSMIVGRIRAEMGLPTHELERLGPTVMQGNILGPRLLGNQNITSLSVFFSFTRGIRNIPLPHQFEALFFQHKVGLNGRKLLIWSIIMIAFAQAWALFWFLFLAHRHGLGADWASWMPWASQEAWRQLAGWIGRNEGFAYGRCIASVVGFFVYFGMMFVRTRFIWWPLHPAGFALSTTWYMAHMWFPMFVAWALKGLVARYSHAKGIRALTSAAYGLILGDIITGTIWILYSIITRDNVYAFWP